MRRIILIGPVGCGKSTLCQALNNLEVRYKKTQAIEVVHNTIDTPGEYLENHKLNTALLITAAQVEIVLLMQSCCDMRSLFPPGFASMFGGKPVWGVVSKTDLTAKEEHIIYTEAMLCRAGASYLYRVSNNDPISIERLRAALSWQGTSEDIHRTRRF